MAKTTWLIRAVAPLFLSLPASAWGQSIWVGQRNDRVVAIEVLKPDFDPPEVNTTLLTSAVFGSVRFAVGEYVIMAGEVPFAHHGDADFDDESESVIGNPRLGIGVRMTAVATSAQEQPSIEPGVRVRVSQCHTLVLRSGVLTTECARYIGILVAIAPDVLEMREDRGMKRSVVPSDSVTKFEIDARGDTQTRVDVHRGTRIHPVRGAAIGFLVGGLATGVYFGIYCDPMADRDACGGSRTEAGLGYGAFGGLIGGFFGMLFGAAIRTDRWEEVPLDQLRVQPVATLDGRLGLAASVRF